MATLNEWVIDSEMVEDGAAESSKEFPRAADKNGEPSARPSDEHVFIQAEGSYTAYAVDLECLWRWEIYLDSDRLVQEGAALSLTSATEAVGHVLAYFSVRDSNISS
jgi:soluble methane monooxygenase-binding protein MmoD